MTIYAFDFGYDSTVGENILTVAGVVEGFSSVIWTNRYDTTGDFELTVPATPENVELLTRGRYLVRAQDIDDVLWRHCKVIERREVITSEEDGDTMTVAGRDLQSILHRRVVRRQTNLAGYVDDCVRSLIEMAFALPADQSEEGIVVPYFGIRTPFNITNRYKMRMQITGANVEEKIAELCQTYGYGYDMYLVDMRENNVFTPGFELYEGTDRSIGQTVNQPVVFSDGFDNLISSDYIENGENFANVAYVAGEGEGDNRTILTVGEGSGLDRYEIWVDARNASSNNGDIPTAVYRAMLKQDGDGALAEASLVNDFNAEVEAGATYVYGEDYNLGDIVSIQTPYSGTQRVRIIEVTESEDETGNTTLITFGNPDIQTGGSSDVVNLFDKDNPNVYSRMYLSAAGTITRLSSTSSPDRTVYVSIEGGKTYRVSCNVASVKRVGTYTARAEGATATAYAGHSTASANDLVVTAGANDTVLCLQLFADSDSQKTLSAYYPSLWIYEN
ncbi:MAG: siphovirus ReqiPepy6 Gp37-like family protein [Clostridia bacterium]|nr:siphovirus ReqiPepy6 Gp37-like family protein [Clostridia bacterium]